MDQRRGSSAGGYAGGGRGGGGRGGGGRGGGNGQGNTAQAPFPHTQLDRRGIFDAKLAMFSAEKKALEGEKSALDIHTLRESFARGTQNKFVLTNHFQLNLPLELHHYAVEGMESKDDKGDDKLPSGGKQRMMMEKVMAACQPLRNHQNDYATDHMRQIVSWKDLGAFFGKPNAQPKTVLWEGTIETRRAPPTDPSSAEHKKIRIEYKGRVPVIDFIKAARGEKPSFCKELRETNTLAVEHAINLIIMKSIRSNGNQVFQVGANRFYVESGSRFLEPGLNAHFGFFATLKMGMGSSLLNVNTATSAFYEPLGVHVFYEKRHRRKMALYDLRVEVVYAQTRKIRTIKSVGNLPPTEQTFDKAGNSTTVFDYLRSKNLDKTLLALIQGSKNPCVNVGGPGSPEWYPMEALKIEQHQSPKKLSGAATEKMIQVAQNDPRANIARIAGAGLQLIGTGNQLNAGSVLKEAGIRINENVVAVPVREIQAGPVYYGEDSPGKNVVEAKKLGRWDLQNKRFYETKAALKGPIGVVVPCDLGRDWGNNCAQFLSTEMTNLGIKYEKGLSAYIQLLDLPPVPGNKAEKDVVKMYKEKLESELTEKLKQADSNGIKLLVFINHDKGGEYALAFDTFKRLAEQIYGLHTICVTHKNLENMDKEHPAQGNRKAKPRMMPQYMANVAMKVNIKLGNTNHVIELSPALKTVLNDQDGTLDTMILGADVTHTQKGSREVSRSLAAVVGSVDETFGQFYGSVSHQERDKEIIENIGTMVTHRLQAFWNVQKRVPTKILFYRDGVDSGQYSKVRKDELLKIKDAWTSFYKQNHPDAKVPTLKMTVVIVTKRHRTRFYPVTIPQGWNTNCSRGTCVDSGVTHPNYFDFFLQSHSPGPGTTKPTHYFVLENGMKFTPKDLQDFTNSLCYTYVRATLPVGYAPPAYYADRLCERVRCYFNEFYKPDDEDSDSNSGTPTDEGRWNAWQKRYNEGGNNRHGPWNEKLNDTMFWM